jgi:hypothetical protein
MAQTSANLVERVLPADVPLRQWVITFPFELRARLGFDAPLLSAVSGVVVDTLLGFYGRRMRDHLGPLPPVPSASSAPSTDDDDERDGLTTTRRPMSQVRCSEADTTAGPATAARRCETARRGAPMATTPPTPSSTSAQSEWRSRTATPLRFWTSTQTGMVCCAV